MTQTESPTTIHRSPVKDTFASISRSALRFLSGTALSRVTGLIRDIALAYAFGTHEAVAALFVAFRLSHFMRRIAGEGAMQSAFIPLFEELRAQEPTQAFQFFRDISRLVSLFLVGFIALTMIGIPLALQIHEWSPGNREILSYMTLLMPSLLFICLFGLNLSLLQCQKRYFTAGIAPAFFNILLIAAALLLRPLTPVGAMPYMAIAIVFGCLVQWLATFFPVRRDLRLYPLQRAHALLTPNIRRLARPFALGLLGVGATQFNNAIDAIFGRYADPQGPAQLWYALRLQQLPLALFGIAVSSAILPPLARAIHAGNTAAYLSFLDFALRRVAALLLPCTAALIVLGTPIVNLIYGHGDFGPSSITTTTACLHSYALGLLPMGVVIVLAPAFYAQNNFRIPTCGAILSLITNLLISCTLVFVLHWPAMSVALAASLAAWCNVLFLYQRLASGIDAPLSLQGQSQFMKIACISIASATVAYFAQSPLPMLFTRGAETVALLPTAIAPQIAALAIPGSIFLLMLIALAKLCRAHDLLELFGHQSTIS